uniref:Rab-GAP TBC domain-containing protein n=1 Tax=Macrostomum lignano TaxID=282301 RepID=A0A1I8F915_9PLAT
SEVNVNAPTALAFNGPVYFPAGQIHCTAEQLPASETPPPPDALNQQQWQPPSSARMKRAEPSSSGGGGPASRGGVAHDGLDDVDLDADAVSASIQPSSQSQTQQQQPPPLLSTPPPSGAPLDDIGAVKAEDAAIFDEDDVADPPNEAEEDADFNVMAEPEEAYQEDFVEDLRYNGASRIPKREVRDLLDEICSDLFRLGSCPPAAISSSRPARPPAPSRCPGRSGGGDSRTGVFAAACALLCTMRITCHQQSPAELADSAKVHLNELKLLADAYEAANPATVPARHVRLCLPVTKRTVFTPSEDRLLAARPHSVRVIEETVFQLISKYTHALAQPGCYQRQVCLFEQAAIFAVFRDSSLSGSSADQPQAGKSAAPSSPPPDSKQSEPDSIDLNFCQSNWINSVPILTDCVLRCSADERAVRRAAGFRATYGHSAGALLAQRSPAARPALADSTADATDFVRVGLAAAASQLPSPPILDTASAECANQVKKKVKDYLLSRMRMKSGNFSSSDMPPQPRPQPPPPPPPPPPAASTRRHLSIASDLILSRAGAPGAGIQQVQQAAAAQDMPALVLALQSSQASSAVFIVVVVSIRSAGDKLHGDVRLVRRPLQRRPSTDDAIYHWRATSRRPALTRLTISDSVDSPGNRARAAATWTRRIWISWSLDDLCESGGRRDDDRDIEFASAFLRCLRTELKLDAGGPTGKRWQTIGPLGGDSRTWDRELGPDFVELLPRSALVSALRPPTPAACSRSMLAGFVSVETALLVDALPKPPERGLCAQTAAFVAARFTANLPNCGSLNELPLQIRPLCCTDLESPWPGRVSSIVDLTSSQPLPRPRHRGRAVALRISIAGVPRDSVIRMPAGEPRPARGSLVKLVDAEVVGPRLPAGFHSIQQRDRHQTPLEASAASRQTRWWRRWLGAAARDNTEGGGGVASAWLAAAASLGRIVSSHRTASSAAPKLEDRPLPSPSGPRRCYADAEEDNDEISAAARRASSSVDAGAANAVALDVESSTTTPDAARAFRP